MKRVKAILCALLASLIAVSNAQGQHKVGGWIMANILNEHTAESVVGATVILKKAGDTQYSDTTVSNKEGHFKFSGLGAGRYRLSITHLSLKRFDSEAITISAMHSGFRLPVIRMKPEAGNILKEVVILSERQYVEQQLDRMIINVGSLISNASASAIDVLNNTPGVVVDEGGSISLRGKEGVMILIDDKPTHLSGSDLVSYLESLPSGTLDKIEVMSNPPAKYNASGGGGIVNIKTKKNRNLGFNGHLSLSYGRGKHTKSGNSASFNYRQGGVNISGTAGYSVYGNFYDVDRVRDYAYEDPARDYTLTQKNFETNRKRSTNYKLGVDYDLSKRTSLGILVNGFTSPYSENGSYVSRFTTHLSTTDSTVYTKSRLDNHSTNNTVSLFFSNRFNKPGNELSLNIDYLNYSVESDQSSEGEGYLDDGSFKGRYNLIVHSPYSAEIYSAKADYSGKLFKNITIETGLQTIFSSRKNRGDYFSKAGSVLIPNQQLTNAFGFQEIINGGYLSFRKSVNRLSVQAGLRAENTVGKPKPSGVVSFPASFILNYTNLFPSVHVAYKTDTNPQNSINLAAGKRIGRPGYQDLNPSIFFFDRHTSNKGNPLLEPDYSTNVDLSYNIARKYSLALTYSRIRNKITSVYTQIDQAFVLTSANIGRATSFGVTANGSFSIVKGWTVNLYGEAINTDYNGIIFGDEQLDHDMTAFRLSGQNQVDLTRGWRAEIGGQFRSRRISGQGIFKPVGQLNMTVQKKLFDSKGALTLSVRDALHTWVIKREMSIFNLDVVSSNINDTRQAILSFSYRFGKASKNRERSTGLQSEAGRAGI